MKYRTLFIALAIAAALPAIAKEIRKASAVITLAQLNNVLGYNFKLESSSVNYCEYKSDNGFARVSVAYHAYKTPQEAFLALREGRAANLAMVKKGEKAENEYNVLGTVPEAKPDDYYLSGDGSITAGPNAVSFRFLINNAIITFNVRGIMKTLVVPRLGTIYNTVLKNTGKQLH
jgi:hypothetical protein